MYEISNNGYILLKNVLSKEQLQNGLKCDNNDGTVNYICMKKFIDNDFMPTIKNNVKLFKTTNYIKFRYSNNNNSIDASTFHSDIYNHTDSEIIPIYTCLCYFDRTQLEVIPGSHKKAFHRNNTNSISSFYKKIIITVNPGDILIFHANLYHRGIGFNSQNNRRILQVFEVFPNNNAYSQYYNKLITVVTSKTIFTNYVSQLSYLISKYPSIIDNLNFFHYILVYNDLQYKVSMSDLPPSEKNNKLITYESGKNIKYDKIVNNYDNNINIVCQNRLESNTSIYYLLYTLSFIVLLVVFIIVVHVYKIKIIKTATKIKRKTTKFKSS